MNRIVSAAVVFAIPWMAAAQAVVPTLGTVTGSQSVVNSGPGNHTNPHVSGDLVSYTDDSTGNSEIRYQNLAVAGSDTAIPPGPNAFDVLSDIDRSLVVYTHITASAQAIFSFDTSTSGPPVELAPQIGSLRQSPSIGGHTVAWQDFGFNPSFSEIVAYDRVSGATTQLTNDLVQNTQPGVSPSGDVVVWTKCTTSTTGCHIWQSTLSGTAWTSKALTNGSSEEELADTNGNVVVYDSTRGGTQTIYWQPVNGGPERWLAFAGANRNPHITGNLVAFEHFDATASNPNWDIYAYDVVTNTVYQVTHTLLDETLNDVSIDTSGTVRVVWNVFESTHFDVYAFSFSLPVSCPGDGDDDRDDLIAECNHPIGFPLVATLSITRDPHHQGDDDSEDESPPNFDAVTFSSPPFSSRAGLLCVESHGAREGWVAIGDGLDLTPFDFSGEDHDEDDEHHCNHHGSHHDHGHHRVCSDDDDDAPTLLARHVDIDDLRDHSVLAVALAGKKGVSFTARIYGPNPACVPGAGKSSTSPQGPSVSQSSLAAPPAQRVGRAVGCSAGGSELALAGLLAVLGWWLARPRAPVRARNPRRR